MVKAKFVMIIISHRQESCLYYPPKNKAKQLPAVAPPHTRRNRSSEFEQGCSEICIIWRQKDGERLKKQAIFHRNFFCPEMCMLLALPPLLYSNGKKGDHTVGI
ncbi:hypothetical protein [Pararhizobium polonicum]|uniref:hypothetical protein n=1 Tax=Pararhizobium polonicum TaxID=1612624 RepID=UPI001111F870|nr:hypothetical protein [Pararhizobium polonicum]